MALPLLWSTCDSLLHQADTNSEAGFPQSIPSAVIFNNFNDNNVLYIEETRLSLGEGEIVGNKKSTELLSAGRLLLASVYVPRLVPFSLQMILS